MLFVMDHMVCIKKMKLAAATCEHQYTAMQRQEPTNMQLCRTRTPTGGYPASTSRKTTRPSWEQIWPLQPAIDANSDVTKTNKSPAWMMMVQCAHPPWSS